jgi:hypothetical protein
MADPKRPDDEKADPKPTTPPDDDAEFELSDEKLGKVAGGLARQRFDMPRIRPISDS